MIVAMILSIVVEVQLSSSFHLQKCCDMHQRLSADLKSCVDMRVQSNHQGNNINSPYEYYWHLPNDTILLSSTDLTRVNSSSITEFELEILQNKRSVKYFSDISYEGVFPLDERISLFDNGSLLLNNESSQPGAGSSIYPQWSYCLDDIFSTEDSVSASHKQTKVSLNFNFAVILKSCYKIPCIRRCCPENMYLIQQQCQYSQNVPKNWIRHILPLNTGE